MQRLAGTIFAIALAAFAGCSSSRDKPSASAPDDAPAAPPATAPSTGVDHSPQSPPRILGFEEGWELASSATYSAAQEAGEVTVKATGEHPTGGYETKLVMSPLRIYPPQWMLAMKKPDGLATQAFTPFEVTASFKANEPVRAVHVSDAAGKHEVPVDQARD